MLHRKMKHAQRPIRSRVTVLYIIKPVVILLYLVAQHNDFMSSLNKRTWYSTCGLLFFNDFLRNDFIQNVCFIVKKKGFSSQARLITDSTFYLRRHQHRRCCRKGLSSHFLIRSISNVTAFQWIYGLSVTTDSLINKYSVICYLRWPILRETLYSIFWPILLFLKWFNSVSVFYWKCWKIFYSYLVCIIVLDLVG